MNDKVIIRTIEITVNGEKYNLSEPTMGDLQYAEEDITASCLDMFLEQTRGVPLTNYVRTRAVAGLISSVRMNWEESHDILHLVYRTLVYRNHLGMTYDAFVDVLNEKDEMNDLLDAVKKVLPIDGDLVIVDSTKEYIGDADTKIGEKK